ncbi:hypothetical protein [Nocardioides sp. 616]|uniref:hypothetical protein n=1 Tax=Nocardioides sp. 616 TaxID=2268090 RepID=UPI000CE57368|nr:hypothetical protein [Nocardioides sp. 616]
MSEYQLTPSRRAVLVAALGAGALLTGCDVEGSASTEPPPPDPDSALLAAVLARTLSLRTMLGETVAAHPSLAPTLSPFDLMHADHLALLGPVGDTSSASPSPAPSVPPAPRRALTRVQSAEGRHASWLRASAGEARSGRFARVLACMSAGVDQHLASAAAARVSP